jgi:hypothetical protein
MKLFECQVRASAHFENTRCESCGLWLGYLPARGQIRRCNSLDQKQWQRWRPQRALSLLLPCRFDVRSWLVRATNPERYCAACRRHNRTIPDLSLPGNLPQWRLMGSPSIACSYTLLKLRGRSPPRRRTPTGWRSISSRPAPRRPPAPVTESTTVLITINQRRPTIPSAGASATKWASPIARCSATSV